MVRAPGKAGPPIPEDRPVFVDEARWLYESGGALWLLHLRTGQVTRLRTVARKAAEPRLRGFSGTETEVLWPGNGRLSLTPVKDLLTPR